MMPRLRFFLRVCVLFGVVIVNWTPAAHAWSGQHNEASVLAAGMSPEPFRSHAKLCVHAGYPDAMQDHAVGHGRDGYALRLFTREAIAAMRAGDLPKAMFFASAATHYLTDQVCVAHVSRAWYHQALDKDPWTRFLPRKYQAVLVPHGKRMVYYEHLKAEASDTCLFLPEPEYNAAAWRKSQGSLNYYFDTMPSVKKYVTPAMLRRPDDWTFNDFDQYARWYGFFIALDMLDPASLKGPQLRLRDAQGMRAVCVEELINGTAQCAAYYGYLSTAAKAEVRPSLDACLPGFDKLQALAARQPVVAIGAQAPWPVERAAHVMALELLRAERRLARTQGRPASGRPVDDYVVRLSAGNCGERLRGRSAVVLVTPADDSLARALSAPRHPSRGLGRDRRAGARRLQATGNRRAARRQPAGYVVPGRLPARSGLGAAPGSLAGSAGRRGAAERMERPASDCRSARAQRRSGGGLRPKSALLARSHAQGRLGQVSRRHASGPRAGRQPARVVGALPPGIASAGRSARQPDDRRGHRLFGHPSRGCSIVPRVL